PECRPGVRALADYVESTSGMCRRAQESEANEMIVGTEIGLVHRLRRENPGKEFYVASEAAVCPNMKRTTLERVFWSLEEMRHRVSVPEATRRKALGAVERMVETVRA
ncbi:MAG: quinolinate synthase NadA, partial [Candidatus Brocadiia bacterium]